jgi:hypothetical protein
MAAKKPMSDYARIRQLEKELADLEDAAFKLLEWDRKRDYIMPYRVRDLIIAALNRITEPHGVMVPPAKLVNGQWEGVPLSQFPELQEQVRKGLADGTLQVEGNAGVGGNDAA